MRERNQEVPKKMVLIVSFDGLHRSGKGTQIGLLCDYLKKKDIMYGVLRGDISRPGVGSKTFYDPVSSWWQEWIIKKDKRIDDWNHAYERLVLENETYYYEFSKINPQGILVIDRSYLSRWFTSRRFSREHSFEEAFNSTTLHPDQYNIIEVPKDALLLRCSKDKDRNKNFRNQIIEEYYDLWEETIDLAKNKLGKQITMIDGTLTLMDIHQIVVYNFLKSQVSQNLLV